MVTVTHGSPIAPTSLFPLMPCKSEAVSDVTLGCITTGFSPATSLSFKWTDVNGRSLTDFVQYPVVQRGSTYTRISQIRVKAADWNNRKSYKCRVEHPSISGEKSATLVLPPERIVAPTITLYPSGGSTKVSLLCSMMGYYPDKITVEWLVDGKTQQRSAVVKKFQNIEEGERTFSLTSTLEVDMNQWNKGVEHTCKATHKSKEYLKRISICLAYPTVTPSIYLDTPRLENIVKHNQETATCLVTAPYPTSISWVVDDAKKGSSKTTYEPSNGTLGGLTLPKSQWMGLRTITCQAEHRCFTSVKKSATLKGFAAKAPVVTIRRSLSDLQKGDKAVLECVITGLSTSEISVTFRDNTGDISEAEYMDLSVTKDVPVISRFPIPQQHWAKEKSFTCRVNSYSDSWGSNSTGEIFGEPSVELFLQPSKQAEIQKLVCSASGFDPKIKWLLKSKERQATTNKIVMGEDGRVTVTSEMAVPPKEWNQGEIFTCEVEDQPLRMPIRKEISKCAVTPLSSQTAKVYLQGPSLDNMRKQEHLPVTCLVVGYDVTEFSITWKVAGKVISQGVVTDSPTGNGNGTQTIRSQLKVADRDWNAHQNVSCEVKHRCSSRPQEKHLSKAEDPKHPEVQIVKPSDSDLAESDNATLLCLVSEFFPSDISIHWELNGQNVAQLRYTNSPAFRYPGSSVYSMHSQLLLQRSQQQEGNYSCVVRHESAERPISDTISNIFASISPSQPTVTILQSSSGPVCLVTGFSPKAINVSWLLNGVTELTNHSTSTPARGPDGKFTVSDRLHIASSDSVSGNIYSCRVSHVTGTLLLNISKPEIVKENEYFDENKLDFTQEEDTEEIWSMACIFITLFLATLLYGSLVTLVKVK